MTESASTSYSSKQGVEKSVDANFVNCGLVQLSGAVRTESKSFTGNKLKMQGFGVYGPDVDM